MRLLKSVLNPDGSGFYRLLVQSANDVYVLSRLVRAGDRVTTRTTRKVVLSRGDGSVDTKRKTLTLTLRVVDSEYRSSDEALRIQGVNVTESNDVPLGSAHSFAVACGTSIALSKGHWSQEQQDAIRVACDPSETCDVALALILRDGTAKVGLLDGDNVTKLPEVVSSIPKKRRQNQERLDGAFDAFYTKVCRALQQSLRADRIKVLVVAGIADVTRPFLHVFNEEYAKAAPFEHMTVVEVKTPQSTLHRAIMEALTNPAVSKDIGSKKWVEALNVLADFRRTFVKNPGLAFYGPADVLSAVAVDSHAIAVLMAVQSVVDSHDLQQREAMRKAMALEHIRSIVCSDSSEPGRQLHKFGGAICIAKYEVFIQRAAPEEDDAEGFDSIDSDF